MANAHGKKKRSKQSNGLTTHVVLFFASIALLLVGKADISAMNSVRSVFSGLAVPVVDIVSVPFRAVYSMMDSMSSVANLREENLKLKEDVRRLQQHRRRAEILQSENNQLRRSAARLFRRRQRLFLPGWLRLTVAVSPIVSWSMSVNWQVSARAMLSPPMMGLSGLLSMSARSTARFC